MSEIQFTFSENEIMKIIKSHAQQKLKDWTNYTEPKTELLTDFSIRVTMKKKPTVTDTMDEQEWGR